MDFVKGLISALEHVTSALKGVSTQDEDWEEDEDGEEVELKETGFQPENEEEEQDILSSLMENWFGVFCHVKERPPTLDELESQFLAAQFAVATVNEIDPALYVLAATVAEEEGYASPPPWAIKIARSAVVEYLTGTLAMLKTCVVDHNDVDIDEETD